MLFLVLRHAVRAWYGSSNAAGELRNRTAWTQESLQLFSLHCHCSTRSGTSIPPTAHIHVQSKPSVTRLQGHLLGAYQADVAEASQSDVVGNDHQHFEGRTRRSGTTEARPVSQDPNVIGFVPAFILGDIYVCKLPERQVPLYANRAAKPGWHVHLHISSSRYPSLPSSFSTLACTVLA